MFGYIKKEDVCNILLHYFVAHSGERNRAFERVLKSSLSDKGLDQRAVRDHMMQCAVCDTIFDILGKIDDL